MPSRRALMFISNPHASSVDQALRDRAVGALAEISAVACFNTEGQGHATELAREHGADFDAVVAFGGDGTVNEVANGVAGSDTPLLPLPGGSTSVYARSIGYNMEFESSLEQAKTALSEWQYTEVDLGIVNDRYFTFSSGCGLSASVVEQVDQNPQLKARFSSSYYAAISLSTFIKDYLGKAANLACHYNDASHQAITLVVQNSSPTTFYKDCPLRVCPNADVQNGSLELGMLSDLTMPIAMKFLSEVLGGATQFSDEVKIKVVSELDACRITATEPFPVEVDGDYIGEVTEANYMAAPGALAILGPLATRRKLRS